jgi:RNA polymerase sigma-70 factor, ECF subfamily
MQNAGFEHRCIGTRSEDRTCRDSHSFHFDSTTETTLMREVEFDTLVRSHEQAVLRTAYRLLGPGEDAKDAVREVFLRLLSNRASVHGNLGAWLYRVTVNICNDHYRQRRQTFELPPNTADPAPNPDYLLRLRERERLVTEGLGLLTKRERATVILRLIKGYSTAEVGQLLQIKEATVRRHIFSARIKLADLCANAHPA